MEKTASGWLEQPENPHVSSSIWHPQRLFGATCVHGLSHSQFEQMQRFLEEDCGLQIFQRVEENERKYVDQRMGDKRTVAPAKQIMNGFPQGASFWISPSTGSGRINIETNENVVQSFEGWLRDAQLPFELPPCFKWSPLHLRDDWSKPSTMYQVHPLIIRKWSRSSSSALLDPWTVECQRRADERGEIVEEREPLL